MQVSSGSVRAVVGVVCPGDKSADGCAVVPVAQTGNLPPELRRVGLIDVPPSWYYAHRRSSDGRPALLTAIDLMTEFTESITQSAVSERSVSATETTAARRG